MHNRMMKCAQVYMMSSGIEKSTISSTIVFGFRGVYIAVAVVEPAEKSLASKQK
jgi:hypothetical protein